MRTHPPVFLCKCGFCGSCECNDVCASQTKASGLAPGKASAPTPELQRPEVVRECAIGKNLQGRQRATRPELPVLFPSQKWR
jgi:hypothetical protein